MSSNAAIDIAIGLILMYLVLSLMATVVNEMIASAMKWRATILQAALTSILDNPTLRADFYDHGIIDGANAAIGGDHTSYLSGTSFATALLASVDPTKPVPGFSDVEQAIKQMPDCNIRDILLSHIEAAQGDLSALRDGIANYFDSAMDRVSGLYKRKMKILSLVIAAIIAVLLNADTLAVGRALWRDATLRAQMVQTADTVLKSAPAPVPQPTDTRQSASGDPVARLQTLEEELRPLPLGWPDRGFKVSTESLSNSTVWGLTKLIGLILTTLAISLGAPFWFDTLSKFMNVRSTGKKPKRSVATQ